MRCDREGCEKPGTKCMGCRCAVYCSKDCQRYCYSSHKTVCKRLAQFNMDEDYLDRQRRETGLTPSEILTILRYPMHYKKIPPVSEMEVRRQGAKKRFANFQRLDTVQPHIARLCAKYPVERFYIRRTTKGIDSPARIFGISDCGSEAALETALMWTIGCRVLNDVGRDMLKSTSVCENIFVPVLASELSEVDEYPEEMTWIMKRYSKTPGIYLDPYGWELALSAYHDHDKTCSGCGIGLCASCGRREDQTTEQLTALSLH